VYYRFRLGWVGFGLFLENLYNVGLGWVNNTVGFAGLGPANLDACPSLAISLSEYKPNCSSLFMLVYSWPTHH